ncbi:MAG: SMC-Scp complex subunit ScpB [Candidatus Thiodiazotropha sp. (ex Notomyrtea botanica)]|nr:SMC-Scp complex subunit ScpB [Candidatus Thiodiazotropha sp. (ex Notomyrtea botanica)]
MSSEEKLKQIVEAALLAAGRPLSLDQLLALFEEKEQPEKKQLREVLAVLMEDYQGRGIEVVEVGSGFRIQVSAGLSPWVSRLWAERPPKYSRALLETLALIAYRQPITRGEIEDIRGVSVSTNIIKTLTEREWVRVVGHRDVPGKPALYATTKEFLDYFNLKSLNELPTLAEIRDLDSINRELELSNPDKSDEPDAESESESDDETDEQAVSQQSDQLTDKSEVAEDSTDDAPIDISANPTSNEETTELPSNDNVIEFEPELKPKSNEQD